MPYGLIHYNAPGDTLEEFFRYAAETGFETVELQWRDVWPEGADAQAAHEEARKVKQMLDSFGLKCSQLAAGNDFVLLDADAVRAQVERFRTICELAEILGTAIVRTEGGQPKDEVPEDRWVDAICGCIEKVLEFAEPMGITLAIDNHGWITNNVDVLLAILERLNHPQVGTNLDTMNYRWFGYPVEVLPYIYRRVAPWVKHTHLKDGTGSRSEYKGCALGEGEIPLAAAVEALRQAGYRGVWCAEYEGPRDQAADGYRRCLEWMRQNCYPT